MAKSDFSCVKTPFLSGSRHCTSVLQTQFPKLCTDLHLCLLYILILGTYSNFARKNHFLARRLLSAALLECWLQVCRVKITFTILPTNRFVCTTKKLMKCVVNWILLRIRVRSRNIQPHLKGGPELLEKKINEILGSKPEDRFSTGNPFFEMVQKTCQVCFSYLLLGNNLCKSPRTLQTFLQKCQKIAGC